MKVLVIIVIILIINLKNKDFIIKWNKIKNEILKIKINIIIINLIKKEEINLKKIIKKLKIIKKQIFKNWNFKIINHNNNLINYDLLSIIQNNNLII